MHKFKKKVISILLFPWLLMNILPTTDPYGLHVLSYAHKCTHAVETLEKEFKHAEKIFS